MMDDRRIEAVIIGGSAGSMEALLELLSPLSATTPIPVIVVCHIHPEDQGELVSYYQRQLIIPVGEAQVREPIERGHVYFAPAGYHLLVETDKTFTLTADEKVNYSRPSIDVCFDSAAFCWADRLAAIILTGASSDGAEGIRAVKRYGGMTIAQNPVEAAHSVMPQASIDTGHIDHVWSVHEIGVFLTSLDGSTKKHKAEL